MILIGDKESKPDYDDWAERIAEGGQRLADADAAEKSSYPDLQSLYADLFTAISKQRGIAESNKNLYQSQIETNNGLTEAKDQAVREKEDTIAGLRRQLNDVQVSLESAEEQAREEQDRLRSELDELDDEKSAEIADLDRKVWIEKSLRLKAEDRIAFLEKEIKKARDFDQVEPDGAIVASSNELGYAWIDLGKKDRLRRGVVFDVFQYVKGGKRLSKGRVEVLNMERDTAKVRILSTNDPLNPIAKGDQIASPFYNGDETPVFVIAGTTVTSQRMDRSELERRINNYGGVIEDKVRIETTYLVALSGYEDTDQYDEARKLGITIVREGELLRFLDY